MKKVIIFFINLYQVTPMHAHYMCRFTPTCSEYMTQPLTEYGVCKGVMLGLKRIKRCIPFGEYGYDPVRKKENYEKN